MRTQEHIQKLEKEIKAIWKVIDDELLWHPSIIKEIRRRSILARQAHVQDRLRKAAEFFS